MVDKLVAKIDGYGQWSFGYVDREIINWISGWYTFIPNIESDGYNCFSLDYTTGYPLYDQYSTTLAGGSDAVDVTTTETYVCPTQLGIVLWADINPAGAGVGSNYTVDGIYPAHLCRARKKNHEPYTYLSGDGYYHEIFLLFGYSNGLVQHTFYWVYNDYASSLWTQVPDLDPSLPVSGEFFDVWIPASVNISQVKWSSGLVQDVDKLVQGDSGGSPLERTKVEALIDNANYIDGTTPFTTIDITNLLGTNDVILAFCNGIEANVYVGDPAFSTTGSDIIVDTNSVGYPSITDVYWNGSSRFPTASLLGDLVLNDIIRLYYITTV